MFVALQYEGWMDRFTYKKWSATINVFFRAPFACVTGFIGLTSIHSQWAQHTSLQVSIITIMIRLKLVFVVPMASICFRIPHIIADHSTHTHIRVYTLSHFIVVH